MMTTPRPGNKPTLENAHRVMRDIARHVGRVMPRDLAIMVLSTYPWNVTKAGSFSRVTPGSAGWITEVWLPKSEAIQNFLIYRHDRTGD